MEGTPTATIPLARRQLVALAAAVLGALVVVAGIAGAADASRAHVLGKTKKTPKPSCPTPKGSQVPTGKTCQVMGQVTGFQLGTGDKRSPFEVRQSGHIVAWSVDLSRPDKSERNFLSKESFKKNGRTVEGLGWGKPSARLAILRSEKRNKYKLAAQSSVMKLASLYGETPVFTLDKTLRVKKGDIVALTTSSWVPNLAHNRLPRDESWISSRNPKSQRQCDQEKFLREDSKPQVKVKSVRRYACAYQSARLLYWAYLVPSGSSSS